MVIGNTRITWHCLAHFIGTDVTGERHDADSSSFHPQQRYGQGTVKVQDGPRESGILFQMVDSGSSAVFVPGLLQGRAEWRRCRVQDK